MSELGQPENGFPTCEKYNQLQHETLLKLGFFFAGFVEIGLNHSSTIPFRYCFGNRRNLKFLFLPQGIWILLTFSMILVALYCQGIFPCMSILFELGITPATLLNENDRRQANLKNIPRLRRISCPNFQDDFLNSVSGMTYKDVGKGAAFFVAEILSLRKFSSENKSNRCAYTRY